MKFNVKLSEKTRRELTPVRGVDYFTDEDILDFKAAVTPRYKVDYFTDTEVEELRKTLTPSLEDIYAQLTPFATRDKLISIEVEDEKLPITAIKNLPEILRNIYARGGGQYSNIAAATITARTPSAVTSDVVSTLQFSTDFTLTSSNGGTQVAVALTAPGITQADADLRYLKLAADNDPLTGTLGFSTALNAGTILTVPDSDGSNYSDYTFHLGGGDNASGLGFNTFKFEMTPNTTAATNFRNIVNFSVVDQVTFENIAGNTFGFERFTSPGEGWSFNSTGRMAYYGVAAVSFNLTDGAGSGGTGSFIFNENAVSGGAGDVIIFTPIARRILHTAVANFTNVGAIAMGGTSVNNSGFLQIRPGTLTTVGGTSFGTLNIQQVGNRTVPSGTTAFVGDLTIVPGTTSVSSGATLTTLAGLYISGAPTKSGTGTLSNGPYAVHVDAGTSRFDGDIQMLGDNVSTIYGAGLDASIYYDGTNFVFNPKLVGTGYVDILGALQVDAGTSTSNVKVGGKLTTNTTTVGNVTTGEDNLMTYSVPANTLSTNGDTLRFYASGTFTANANSKQLKVYFGSTAVSPPLDTTTNAIDWSVTGEIIRTGATTQKMWVSFTSWDGSASVTFVDYVTPAETLSGAVTFKLTGEGTSTDDIKQETLTIDWLPA